MATAAVATAGATAVVMAAGAAVATAAVTAAAVTAAVVAAAATAAVVTAAVAAVVTAAEAATVVATIVAAAVVTTAGAVHALYCRPPPESLLRDEGADMDHRQSRALGIEARTSLTHSPTPSSLTCSAYASVCGLVP